MLGPGHAVAPRRPQLDLPPAFPQQAQPGQKIKLPGQSRVAPEEYREFLILGHGGVFDLDVDKCGLILLHLLVQGCAVRLSMGQHAICHIVLPHEDVYLLSITSITIQSHLHACTLCPSNSRLQITYCKTKAAELSGNFHYSSVMFSLPRSQVFTSASVPMCMMRACVPF